MTKGDTTPIYTISSGDTYVFIEKVGKQVNKSLQNSTSKSGSSENTFNECSNSTLQNNSSVKFSNTESILINEYDYEADDKSSTSDVNIPSKKLDAVQSGESLIKYYYFDSSKYSRDINKCIEFWKSVMEQENLKPVECIYTVSNFDFSSESEKISEEDENIIKVMSCNVEEPKQYIWYNALIEMQKRKMDELALAACGPRCKLCEPEMGMSKFKTKQGKNYAEEELKDNEDIVCLNNWAPKSIKKPQVRQISTVSPEPGKRKEREDSFEVDKIDESEPVKKCACEKNHSTCSLTTERKCEKLIALKNTEGTVSQDVKPIDVTADVKPECVVRDRKEKTKTEKITKFQITPNQKMTEKVVPLIKHRKSIIKTSTPTAMIPASTVQKTVQFKSREVNVTEEKKTKCDICKIDTCTCKEYFDENSKEFVNEVRYELQHHRKDKACYTDEEQMKMKSIDLNFCSVCEDKTMCDVMHKKIQAFELVIPTKEEDVYIETVFESGLKWQTGSTTILPRARGKKKSMAFGSITKSAHILKNISDVLPTRNTKPFDRKSKQKNTDIVYIHKEESDETIKESSLTDTKEEGPLLWYSSEI
ncbi:hypothetical protein RN001_012169 [Aquatica leii]|uniref:Uncharacterized protein n=1 Tax=Aquatica leii TaxID=1421715 RepID=A0AAN7SD65_9COLE|nr:hypothetical protein RN001_012169 [Aquatica leii]